MKKNILNIFYLKIKKNKIVMIGFEPMTSTLLEWCSNPTELQYLIFNLSVNCQKMRVKALGKHL